MGGCTQPKGFRRKSDMGRKFLEEEHRDSTKTAGNKQLMFRGLEAQKGGKGDRRSRGEEEHQGRGTEEGGGEERALERAPEQQVAARGTAPNRPTRP